MIIVCDFCIESSKKDKKARAATMPHPGGSSPTTPTAQPVASDTEKGKIVAKLIPWNVVRFLGGLVDYAILFHFLPAF